MTTTLHVYDFTQGDKDQKGTAEREGRHHQLSERRRMTLPETGGRLRCPSPLQRPIRPYLVAVTRQRRNHRSSVWREQRTAITERVGVSAGGDLTHQPAAPRRRQPGLQWRAAQLIPEQPDHLRAFAAFACLVLGGRQRFLLLTVPATQNLLPGSHSASSHAHTNDRQGRLVLRRHVQRNRWPTQHEKPTTT